MNKYKFEDFFRYLEICKWNYIMIIRSLLRFFRKFFCKHRYIYFEGGLSSTIIGMEYQGYYICNKCGKKKD